MINAKEFVKALKTLEDTKNITLPVALDALTQALTNAYQKVNGKDALVRVDIDEKEGKISMFSQKNIVAEVEDDFLEISVEDAQEINPEYKVGDVYEIPVDTDEFDRMAALHVKQVLRQKIREAEKQVVYDAYIDKKDDIIMGVIERVEKTYCLINVGKANALMPSNMFIPNEKYSVGQHVKVYIVDVDKSSQGAQVIVSRNDSNFLKRLFESEIVEVYDGSVEIRSIARDPGERAKVAVSSRDKNIDPTGACIGVKGMRIQKISNQLANEKIDVVQFHEEPELYIAESLKPANVYGMVLNPEMKSVIAIVPNEQLSLAIGKKGQNARLAVKLTGWKIDIKTVDAAMAEKINYTTMSDIRAKYDVVASPRHEPRKITPKVDPVVSERSVAAKPEVVKPVQKPQEVYVSKVKFDVPAMPRVSVIEETPAKPVAKPTRNENRLSKKALKKAERAKQNDNKPANFMPVYTEEELKALETVEEVENTGVEDVDYDEFDEYYDEPK
jgi:transcription termination/antitermination protein NusA